MKAMKKLFALLLALTMVFGLAATAYADEPAEPEEPSGTITISPAFKGEKYSIYRIFNLTYEANAATGEGYVYTLRPEGEAFGGDGTGSFYLFEADIDGDNAVEKVTDYITRNETTKIVTWNTGVATTEDGAPIREFALLVKAFLATNTSIQPENGCKDIECTGDYAGTGTALDGQGADIVKEKMPLGYYYVSTTTGSIVSLDTNDDNVTIADKQLPSSNDKKQAEDGGSTYSDSDNTVSIGDVVKYQSTITVKPGVSNLIFHDTMTEGLTFDNTSVKVMNGTTELTPKSTTVATPGATPGTTYQYELSENNQKKDDTVNCTFHLEFSAEYLAKLTADALNANPTTPAESTLVVTYEARVNDKAIMEDKENDGTDTGENNNKSMITWGEKGDTTWDKVESHSFQVTVIKFAGESLDDANKKLLANAKFKLYTDCANGEPSGLVHFHTKSGETVADGFNQGTGSAEEVFYVCTKTDCTETKYEEIVTNKSGTFNIKGLDKGDYYLVETEAPDGYNLLEFPLKVEIVWDETANEGAGDYVVNVYGGTAKGVWSNTSLGVKADAKNEFGVKNSSGQILPSTGGVGTTLFYVFGGLMVVGAAVLLVTKKRMSV